MSNDVSNEVTIIIRCGERNVTITEEFSTEDPATTEQIRAAMRRTTESARTWIAENERAVAPSGATGVNVFDTPPGLNRGGLRIDRSTPAEF